LFRGTLCFFLEGFPVIASESTAANATSNDSEQPDQSEASQEPLSPQEAQQRIAQLKAQVSDLQNQVKDREAKYVYLYADFENFKKRAIKERADAMKFGAEPMARELLQVVDNIERALSHMPAGTDKTLVDGLKMTLNQFKAVLEKQGIQSVPTLERPFDPNIHEAVAQEASEHPEGTVTQEHSRGYTIHGRLLRPARVVVSSGPAGKSQATS
jgi:molecular chaperone GrpE